MKDSINNTIGGGGSSNGSTGSGNTAGNGRPAGNDKRSSLLLRFLSLAVLVMVLLYFGVQIYNYAADPLTFTLVYESQAEDTIVMEGWLVRTEEPLPTCTGSVTPSLAEGQKAAAGETVAMVYSDESALTTVSRIETLELQLQQLQFSLTSYLDDDASLKLDTSITGYILTLRETLAAGDYAAAESDLAQLKAAVLKRDSSYGSQEDIQEAIEEVEADIAGLKATLTGATAVKAPSSGIYSAVCDGYESVLTEAFLEDVTPSALNTLQPTAAGSSVGKMIYGDKWYYAAVLPAEQAASLATMSSVELRLTRGFEQTIRMSVESVSREENGQAAVVLSSSRYLSQTTLLRHQAADAVLHTYEGLRVPANALRVNEQGVTGVYCVDGENASFRPVTVVYQGEGYALVTAAKDAGDTRTLRVGDQVISTTKELYDGKVIR